MEDLMKEFVEKLREKADVFEKSGCAVEGIVKDYRKSADMIEKLCGNIGGFVEKLIERLEEEKKKAYKLGKESHMDYGTLCGWISATDKAIENVNQLAEEYSKDLPKENQGYTSEKEEKIKVTELGVIVTGTKDKPYFEIKYKEVGKEDYNIGYSSYKLDYVLGWKEECFEIVTQDLRKENKGWIAVKERLPEYKGEYLITTNFGVTSALYLPKSKKWVGTIEQYFEYSCVAWQPLPESYKPEEKPKFSNEKLDRIMDKILDNQDLDKVKQEPKTRIEYIRSMSVEELADAILERSEISTAIDFCQNFEQCYKNVPEEKCRECLIKYLNSPVEQKKVIPTDYYMERFTEVV